MSISPSAKFEIVFVVVGFALRAVKVLFNDVAAEVDFGVGFSTYVSGLATNRALDPG